MPKEIYLVKVGMTMTEGMVSQWYIADGQQVKKGQLLYALETEKVNLDVDAEADGTVKHLAATGVTLEPGAIVGLIFEAGEELPDDLGQASPALRGNEVSARATTPVSIPPPKLTNDGRIKSSPAARRLARELAIDYRTLAGTGPGGRILEADVQAASQAAPASVATGSSNASPLARRLARQRGLELSQIPGSGPGGRIVQADVEAMADTTGEARPATKLLPGESIPVTGMRRTIANRMLHSLKTSAQLTMDMEVIMDDAVNLRDSLITEWAAEGVRPTYTDLVVRAVSKALMQHPLMNSVFGEQEITLVPEIHIGIAVALPEGLLVPVVRHANQLDLKALAGETARLAAAARQGTLGLDDYAGGTFTLSALGMFGVTSFTPIINAPQAGILGVNRLYEGVTWKEDRPVKTNKMNLSLTWDHRVLDGAPAAAFLAEVGELLANPYRLLV